MEYFRSERNGKEGTKEWWMEGWDKVGFDQQHPMPVDLWERLVKIFELKEVTK